MAGAAIQARFQTALLVRQYAEQRKLSDEEHTRSQVVVENDRVRQRIEDQIEYGRKINIALARFRNFGGMLPDSESKKAALMDAAEYAGCDASAKPPFPTFPRSSEIEDGELSECLSAHLDLVLETDSAFSWVDAKAEDFTGWPTRMGKVDELARKIDLRCRVLQRTGKPF